MPMTTMLHQSEVNQVLSDRELSALLHEVRSRTGQDWQIVERVHQRKRWLCKTETTRLYDLYVYVGGVLPWQCIGLAHPDPRSRRSRHFGTFYSGFDAELVAAYLLGILSGMDHPRRANH